MQASDFDRGGLVTFNRNYTDAFLNQDTTRLFSDQHVNMIRDKITELLSGYHPSNKQVKVPVEHIRKVLDTVYSNQNWDIVSTTDKTIEIICTEIKSGFTSYKINEGLDMRNTIFDGTRDLRQHPPIKLKENTPTGVYDFNVRY